MLKKYTVHKFPMIDLPGHKHLAMLHLLGKRRHEFMEVLILVEFINKLEVDQWLVLARRHQEFHSRLGFKARGYSLGFAPFWCGGFVAVSAEQDVDGQSPGGGCDDLHFHQTETYRGPLEDPLLGGRDQLWGAV